MSEQQYPDGISRRSFLRMIGLTAAAAAATGGGAAFLKPMEKPPVISVAQPALPKVASLSPGLSDIAPAAAGNDMLARLAASQAEVTRLQIVNDQMRSEIAALRAADGNNRAQHETMTMELEQANGQLGIFGGLLALYQQLDETDMGSLIQEGLGVVGEKITELAGSAPALLSGLDAGERSLSEMEASLPALENGRAWIDSQRRRLAGFYGDIESRLRAALDRAGEFFEMLAAWFDGLRRWLPFNAGQRAAEVMRSMTALLAEMPGTIDGLEANLARPLDVWLARENGEPALTRKLVRPLRDGALAPARQAADQATIVETAFEQSLASPGRAALAARAALRDQIAAYRTQHQI